jgi:hypothetical protein
MGFKLNPNFKKKSYIKEYVFNDKHIAFNSNDNNNFLSSHLKYDELNHRIDIGINYFNRFNIVLGNNYRPIGNYVENENSNDNDNDNNDNNDNNSDNDSSSEYDNNNNYDENNDDEDSIS